MAEILCIWVATGPAMGSATGLASDAAVLVADASGMLAAASRLSAIVADAVAVSLVRACARTGSSAPACRQIPNMNSSA
ncbi:hypothetical protein JCM10599A_49130 [Paraburkholderia kururiensis]